MEEKSYTSDMEEQELETEYQEEENENDTEAMEMSRLLRLYDLLSDMKMEVMLSEYEEEPVLRIWPEACGEELDCYLRYHFWSADQGVFLLEAMVPMEPFKEDETKILKLCMEHNRESLTSTVYPEEGRLYLRMVYRESGTAVDEASIRAFLRELVEEWEFFSALREKDMEHVH